MPKLAHSLNKSVIVAIPAFFGDDAPRRCTLVDIESTGLWFTGDALSAQLRKFEDAAPPDDAFVTVFFPFHQIVFVFDPAQFAPLARSLGARVRAGEARRVAPRAARISRRGRRRDDGSKEK
jgi:hypothetical protein